MTIPRALAEKIDPVTSITYPDLDPVKSTWISTAEAAALWQGGQVDRWTTGKGMLFCSGVTHSAGATATSVANSERMK